MSRFDGGQEGVNYPRVELLPSIALKLQERFLSGQRESIGAAGRSVDSAVLGCRIDALAVIV
jgi:hypothetical protein